jgi:hypothetical protein
MVTLGNYWGNEALQYLVRNRTVWASLHTSNPGPTGLAASEAVGYGYERIRANFTVPASRTTLNSQNLVWDNLPAMTIKYVAVWDAQEEGNIISFGALSPNESVSAHGQFVLQAGDFAILL